MCFLDWLYSLKTQHHPEQASTTSKNTLRPLELTLMTCVCVRSVSFFFIKCTFILLKCFSPLLSDEAIPSSFGQCCQLLLRFDDNSIIIKAPTHRHPPACDVHCPVGSQGQESRCQQLKLPSHPNVLFTFSHVWHALMIFYSKIYFSVYTWRKKERKNWCSELYEKDFRKNKIYIFH